MIHQVSGNRTIVTSEHAELWQRVRAGNDLAFSRRVARENGWSKDYTRRVIEEHRRFAFLATVAGHPVSDPTSSIGWDDVDPHFPLLIPEL